MAEQAHVSFRCPADILDAVKKATAGGAQRSKVIIDALRIGLGLVAPGGAGRPWARRIPAASARAAQIPRSRCLIG